MQTKARGREECAIPGANPKEGGCVNDYGQIESHVDHKGKSSVGQAADDLLEAFTMYAYGVYGVDAESAAVPAVDGVHMSQKANQTPQHQLNTDTIRITCPQFAAEKRDAEQELWKVLRRRLERMGELKAGICLKCHSENDQPRRRFCSDCEKKLAQRRELLDT
jgi:hypothetical protein